MKNKKTLTPSAQALRKKAEEILEKKKGNPQPDENTNFLSLLHELEVHQVELEMQSQELWITKAKKDSAYEKLAGLCELSNALFTLSPEGEIIEMNQMGMNLLGLERSPWEYRSFRNFVAPADRGRYQDFLKEVFELKSRQTCQLDLMISTHENMNVKVEGIVGEDGQQCQLCVKNKTLRRNIEKKLIENARELKNLSHLKENKDEKVVEYQVRINQLLDKMEDEEED